MNDDDANSMRISVSQQQLRFRVVFVACMFILCAPDSLAQNRGKLPVVGVRVGSAIGNTILTQNAGYLTRAYFRHSFARQFYGELDLGYGMIGGDSYRTQIVPFEYRFVIVPQPNISHAPYVYVGLGATNFEIESRPARANKNSPNAGWSGHLPIGLGLTFMLDELAALEFSTGYSFAFTDDLDAVNTGRSDGFWSVEVGIGFGGERDDDPDRDGLKTREETTLGTDPRNPDTDGDGLPDGEEIHKYRTNPLKSDTDGDGLTDGEEVLKYLTDPLKADSDEDGLNDGIEILRYHTDPNKVDTDGDGLNDGIEVQMYNSEPLRVDTDGDGLTDGDEALRFKTNPLNVDSDSGTVADGIEMKRGTNPLDSRDDILQPEKEELKVEMFKPVVLEGVVFRSGSAEITPESYDILEKAFNTLAQNPAIEVEIYGHTDNIGSPSVNLRVSRARAEAVRSYLVSRGIAAGRIRTKAFASIRPRASNATSEGRRLNRRIEFVRVK